jgi:hypothetical protein
VAKECLILCGVRSEGSSAELRYFFNRIWTERMDNLFPFLLVMRGAVKDELFEKLSLNLTSV